MHERKRLMFEHADAFVALPGGIGTLEELVEQLTWAQLGRHKKPILILNIRASGIRFARCSITCGGWIHPCGTFRQLLVAESVDESCRNSFAAARAVSEAEKEMTPVAAERM